MWVLPNNYLPSCRSAQDMVASKEDLISLAYLIESSLTWRSKPSQLRTWLTRWKRVNWFQHLSGRILKPSRWDYFEEQLTSSLAATRVSRFLQRASEGEKTTLDTYGPTSARLYGAYNPAEFSSRMSMVTSASGLTKSSATWKKEVTTRRGEYSRRVKSALHTRENGSTLWLTPRVVEISEAYDTYRARMKKSDNPKNVGKTAPQNLTMQVNLRWATPNTMDHLPQRSPQALHRQATTTRKGRSRPANLREQVNPETVANWPTPTASEAEKYRLTGDSQMTKCLTSQGRRGELDGSPPRTAHLNPDWVEWLMGVPRGWTALDATTAPHDGWMVEPPIPRVVELTADRVDRIRLLGNGVVPQTAAKAWEVLNERLHS